MRGTRKGAKKSKKKGVGGQEKKGKKKAWRNRAIIAAMKMLCVVDAGDGMRAVFLQQRVAAARYRDSRIPLARFTAR